MNCRSTFKKLLFSVNSRTTVAFRAIRSLHFHHLHVHHTVKYIIPLHMWVHDKVRNVSLPNLALLFWSVHHLLHSAATIPYKHIKCIPCRFNVEYTWYDSSVPFRATRILTKVGIDISSRPSLSELPKSR